MLKLKLFILVLALTMIAITVTFTCDWFTHPYFPEGTEFVYRLTDANDRFIGFTGRNPSDFPVMQVKYLDKVTVDSRPYPETIFYFETLDTGSRVKLFTPSSITKEVKLDSGVVYQIASQVLHGWPTSYGLIISKDADVIFLGITDWQADGHITVDDAFLPKLSLPVKVEQTRILSNHYKEGDDFYIKKTNTEIMFTLGDKSVKLHQGQLAIVGDYEINLLIARVIQYKQNVYDAGRNGLSFAIRRIN